MRVERPTHGGVDHRYALMIGVLDGPEAAVDGEFEPEEAADLGG